MPPTRQSFASTPLPPSAFLILVSLATEPAHGYQLLSDLRERSGGAIDMDPGSLYRLIFKLGEDGLIESADTPENEVSTRRTYRLTTVGRAVLKAETARLAGLVKQATVVTSPRPRRA